MDLPVKSFRIWFLLYNRNSPISNVCQTKQSLSSYNKYKEHYSISAISISQIPDRVKRPLDTWRIERLCCRIGYLQSANNIVLHTRYLTHSRSSVTHAKSNTLLVNYFNVNLKSPLINFLVSAAHYFVTPTYLVHFQAHQVLTFHIA